MPSAGLSLVGFMEEAAALHHLRTACVPADPTDESRLKADWQEARARLGSPVERAGHPEILPIPTEHMPHVVTLMQTPLVAAALQTTLQGSKFQLIEIEPLLAFQFTVDTDRSAHHCKGLGEPPARDELMSLCLPTVTAPEPTQVYSLGQSLLLKARCLNMRILAQGWFPQANAPTVAGVFLGLSLPLAHVVRWGERCYLHNGFHRAVGARLAGATHIPCLFREVHDEQAVGIKRDGTTFDVGLLTSSNPPTVGHFTKSRAWSVRLRAHSRIIHVNWSEYVVYDE